MMRQAGYLLFSLLCSNALAEDQLFFAELPVVASVSRLPQRQADAPASVTVIDREMLRASGVRSLNDIFRLVPGFQTFAHSDTTARVNYHGVTDDNDFSPRVQVLVDGRSLHSPLFRGGVNWALIPVAIEDIERIEVVRGSNSVSYGTNAFLGVINIITVDPTLVNGASVSVSAGSQGVRDVTLRGGGRIGEGNFRVTYQEDSDNGLDDSYDWEDSYRVRRLDARVDYQLGMRDALEFNLGKVEGRFTRGRLDFDNPPTYFDPGDPIRHLDETSTWMQMRWLRTLDENADFSLRYTYSKDTGDEAFIDPGRVPGYQYVNVAGDTGYRQELEAVHQFSPFTGARLVWGGSYRRDVLSSRSMLRGMGARKREVWRGFANGEWKPNDHVTANLGFSNEYDSLAGNHVSPRASLAYHLDAANTVRVGYSRAWRTSSILAYEANYRVQPAGHKNDLVGNPDLTAERLDSWELAYLGDWRSLRMSFDLRLFREKLKDRIYLLRPAASALRTPYSEQAVQDLTLRGHEFQWKWKPLEGTRLIFNYAYINIDSRWTDNGERIVQVPRSSLNDDAIDYIRLAQNSAPGHSTSLMLIQKLPGGLELSLMHYRVGAMKWTKNTNVDAYRRWDARLAYPFVTGRMRGELAYTVQSLDGEHIEQRKSTDDPKARVVSRRQWISLRLEF